jgi:1-deoxy-D-xylulose-5-phosphate reductoisomerase
VVKRIAVLGSTGSIGQQTLDVVAFHPDRFQIVALAAGRQKSLLMEQCARVHPEYLWWDGAEQSSSAANREAGGAKVCPLEEMATLPEVDLVVMATSGKSGLAPTFAALRAGKTVAMANKEVLVMAGHLLQSWRNRLLPIDSEHSSLWQCLLGEQPEAVERLAITASGGALRDYTPEAVAGVTPTQVLQHPTWNMGPKITVDSATLMNKGLEVIETHVLFGVPYDHIDVLMHRESVVHALVEFVDGGQKASLSVPDMRLPIQFALTYPERLPGATPRLDLKQIGELTFAAVDWSKYPCLKLACEAGRAGGVSPAVLSAADEVAVEAFLAGSLPFNRIASVVETVMNAHPSTTNPDLDSVLAADQWARQAAGQAVQRRLGRE